jgi:tRNA dimethylallyltransferase
MLQPLILLPDRAALIDRCDERLAAMFAGGAIEEVASLLARNDIPPDAPVRRAIGVPEIAAMLAGDATPEEALAGARLATRRYAKRQYTWFRHQPPADWPRSESFSTETLNEIFCLSG